MRRDEVKELHYIATIANVPSILERGILCHRLSSHLLHQSIADPDVQQRRKKELITGTEKGLHDYANFYFDAHNPMLSKCRARNDEICVLRIDVTVLDLPGVIVADRNASSDWVRFWSMADGLKAINQERVFARYWTHPQDPYDEMNHKSEKCAEVLVPDLVSPRYLISAYVANDRALVSFNAQVILLSVEINSSMFF